MTFRCHTVSVVDVRDKHLVQIDIIKRNFYHCQHQFDTLEITVGKKNYGSHYGQQLHITLVLAVKK